jgi:hypothetical protein
MDRDVGSRGSFLAIPGTVALTIIFSAFPATRPITLLLTKDDPGAHR